MRLLSIFIAFLVLPVFALDESADLPGKKADGTTLLPNQWSLIPAGIQVHMGDGAVNSAMHPGGRYIAVQHAGHSKHEIAIVDLQEKTVSSTIQPGNTFYGIAFTADGKKLYASGADMEVVHSFDFENGVLKNEDKIALREIKERGIPAGIAILADASKAYVANVWGQRISSIDLKTKKSTDIELNAVDASSVAAPSGEKPTGDLDTDAISKRERAEKDPASPNAPFPFACVLDEAKQRLYVSLWALSSVAVIDLKVNREIARWKTDEHPCEMLLTKSGKILYVANSNKNTVSAINTETGKVFETLWAAMAPDLPPGASPISIALSPDEKLLFVANAGTNCVAVFALSDGDKDEKSEPLGFIPAGWYPTSVRVTPDGKTLCITNGKGAASAPNDRPQTKEKPATNTKPKSTLIYIGSLMKSTLSIITLPADRAKLKEQLATWTAQTYSCMPKKIADARIAKRPADNPIPAKLGDLSPIKYCVYIIKENRTYDQVLGDLKKGNGDPQICLFPQKVTPNQHKIADEYVLLDNFYVDGEVSADGHEWTCGAFASDFVEKFWPLSYGHSGSGKFPYPSEGVFPVAVPGGGYIWDRCLDAKVSYRSYGEFVTEPADSTKPASAKSKALEGHIDEYFRTFDMSYSDIKRAERFISELHRFEKEGDMPRLQIARLPNDHTSGTGAGKKTPTAFVAENDLAVGMVVEALSHSKFWPNLAIFILEDDAQNGADHVDAHRSTAYVISPFTKRKFVDSNMYSTSSMLHTMELILNVKPMSQYDAAALPMFNSFQAKPDLTPFTKEAAQVDLEARNKKTAWGSALSDGMDFASEDKVDDLLLNEIIWKSVKGAESVMPAPIRAAFVFAREDEKKKD